MQAPDGKTYQIAGPDGASDDQVRAEIVKQNPHLAAEPAPAAPAAATAAPPTALQSAIRAATPPDPFTVAGKALGVLRTPVKAAFDLAGKADVAAGIKSPETAAKRSEVYANVPIAVGASALTKDPRTAAQALTQMATELAMQRGGLSPESAAGVVASGAAPFLGAGLGRLAAPGGW